MKCFNIILIVFVGFILSVGCMTAQKKNMTPEKKISIPEISETVQTKISELEEKADSSDSAEDVLKLSFLYSHVLNLKPDYGKSLALMERYISMVPREKRFEFAVYIKSLLKKINEQEKGIERQKRLLRNEKKETRSLIKQNATLQKKINSLKKLDIRLEKQRLSVE